MITPEIKELIINAAKAMGYRGKDDQYQIILSGGTTLKTYSRYCVWGFKTSSYFITDNQVGSNSEYSWNQNSPISELLGREGVFKLHLNDEAFYPISSIIKISSMEWNPLTSLSDRAAMCDQLEIDIEWDGTEVRASSYYPYEVRHIEPQGSNKSHACSLACLKVAAEIGRNKNC